VGVALEAMDISRHSIDDNINDSMKSRRPHALLAVVDVMGLMGKDPNTRSLAS